MLEVDLDDQGDTRNRQECAQFALCCESATGVDSRFKATLVLRQQREGLLAVVLRLQHRATDKLHSNIIRVVLGEILSELQGGVGLARSLLGQRLDGGEIGGVLLAGDGGQDLIGLPLGNLSAQLEHAGGELVLGGESGGVEVDHELVLAGVEGIVDVEELWEKNESGEDTDSELDIILPPSAEKGSIL